MRDDKAGWVGMGIMVATIAMIVFLLMCTSPVEAAEPEAAVRPDWCRAGFVCLPTKDAGTLLMKVELLEEQVSILKAKRSSKLGFAAVCGPAASLSSTDGGTTLAGTISCAVGYGWRF